MTVPHGLRSSDQRERRRHDLVEEAVATTELARYAAVLAEVDRVDWFGFWSELVLRVGVPIVPEYVAHQHAKARLLAAEYRRRRQPAACQGAVRGAEDEGSTVDLPWGTTFRRTLDTGCVVPRMVPAVCTNGGRAPMRWPRAALVVALAAATAACATPSRGAVRAASARVAATATPAATPIPVADSGGLGLPRRAWEAVHRPTDDVRAEYRDDRVVAIEQDAGPLGWSLDEARRGLVEGLLPRDATPLRSQMRPDFSVVDTFDSPSLGPFAAVYTMTERGRVTSYRVSFGVPTLGHN